MAVKHCNIKTTKQLWHIHVVQFVCVGVQESHPSTPYLFRHIWFFAHGTSNQHKRCMVKKKIGIIHSIEDQEKLNSTVYDRLHTKHWCQANYCIQILQKGADVKPLIAEKKRYMWNGGKYLNWCSGALRVNEINHTAIMQCFGKYAKGALKLPVTGKLQIKYWNWNEFCKLLAELTNATFYAPVERSP